MLLLTEDSGWVTAVEAGGERVESAGRVGMGMLEVRFRSSREGLLFPCCTIHVDALH